MAPAAAAALVAAVRALPSLSRRRLHRRARWRRGHRASSSQVEIDEIAIGDVDRVVSPLPPPSPEQASVVRSVCHDRANVICEAVAGSGKTTTVLHCAAAAPGIKFLCLTYNARLKLHARKRAAELGLANLEVHSFHALGARYYVNDCRNDEALRRLVDGDFAPRNGAPAFDCLVVDEAQDLTPLLHRLVLKAIRDRDASSSGATPASLLILGDSRQSIYQFRDADSRFLTFADRGLYRPATADADETENDESETDAAAPPPPPPWRLHTLRTSFRATPAIASFVNDVMLGYPCIAPSPHRAGRGTPVAYMVGDAFAMPDALADEIDYLLTAKGYAHDDIFILTPSLKGAKLNSKTPLARLENALVTRLNAPVFVSASDEGDQLDSGPHTTASAW
jgi:hypothetical protein